MIEVSRSLTIRFEPDVPDEIKDFVEPILEKSKGFIPGWVEEFLIQYEPRRDARMPMRVSYRARYAVLVMTGLALTETQSERENTLLHELVHILLAPLACVAESWEEALPEGVKPIMRRAFDDAVESVTEDCCRAFGRVSK